MLTARQGLWKWAVGLHLDDLNYGPLGLGKYAHVQVLGGAVWAGEPPYATGKQEFNKWTSIIVLAEPSVKH